MSKLAPRVEAMINAAKKLYGTGWQSHLAAAAAPDLSQPLLSKIARGDRALTDAIAQKIAEAFLAKIAERIDENKALRGVARMLTKPT